MYPLLLKTLFKDYLWGGDRLKKEFGFTTEKENIAEAWMLSCYKNNQSIILNGELKGKTLNEAIDIFGWSCLGKDFNKYSYFPILIKLIDAKENLSIQVHPNNEYALKNEGENGKTEMWYILDCESDSKIIYGVKEEISQEKLNKKIEDGSIIDICNIVPVKKGDMFFIPSGTLHGIGKGILIAEVQQNSNVTYRVFDYERVGKDGKIRELHKKQACEVINKTPNKIEKNKRREEKTFYGINQELVKCDFFTTNFIKLENEIIIKEEKSFVSIVVVSGYGELYYEKESLKLKKGSSVFVPANFEVKIKGQIEMIITKI